MILTESKAIALWILGETLRYVPLCTSGEGTGMAMAQAARGTDTRTFRDLQLVPEIDHYGHPFRRTSFLSAYAPGTGVASDGGVWRSYRQWGLMNTRSGDYPAGVRVSEVGAPGGGRRNSGNGQTSAGKWTASPLRGKPPP